MAGWEDGPPVLAAGIPWGLWPHLVMQGIYGDTLQVIWRPVPFSYELGEEHVTFIWVWVKYSIHILYKCKLGTFVKIPLHVGHFIIE